MTTYTINEGQSFTITENFTGWIGHEFDPATGFYKPFKPGDRVQLLGGAGDATGNDFTNNSLGSWTTLDQNMNATWTITAKADGLTEGTETHWLEGLDSSNFYKVVINDTSQAPVVMPSPPVAINGSNNVVGNNNVVTTTIVTTEGGREVLSDAVDRLTGQAHINKSLMGGDDFLEVVGGDNNFANGNRGADMIVVRGGKGRYLGGRGNDRLEVFDAVTGSWVNGNQGDDLVAGSIDAVTYRGGIGNDILSVSAGTVFGDDGIDIFQAIAGAGVAVVQDYTAGQDFIQGVAGGSFTLTEQGLSYGVGGDQMLLLVGVTDASQVVFA